MAENVQALSVENIFLSASKLPYCKINREKYLTQELRNKVPPEQLVKALTYGTVYAGIPMTILDSIANGAISLETSKVTLLSTLAGIPGGFAMIGTVPADLAQFYAHVFRITQKLAYIYGAKEFELSDGIENDLMIYLGVMFGVNAASAALAKLAAANAVKIGARVTAKPLTKLAIYNISKKILAVIGIKLTKASVGRAVSKSIPFISGFISGGLSISTFLPMANILRNDLAKYTAMSLDDLSTASAKADIVLEKFISVSEELRAETIDDLKIDSSIS